MKNSQRIDKVFLLSVVLLASVGFIIFLSASLGLLAKDGASYNTVATKQFIGLIIGCVAFFVMYKIPYLKLRKYAFYIFVAAIFINLLLFVPFLNMHHGGASRWIDLGFITFQPSEFLKISFIIYFAAWLSGIKEKVSSFKLGIFPYFIIITILSALLLSQSDTDTLVVIAGTGMIMLFAAGARVRDIFIVGLILLTLISVVVYTRPYARERILTYLNSTSDPQGSGYQIQQSMIAIGSGRITGRGFGQSIQKFSYLPEPIGDSIFAVSAEEFGFIGSIGLVFLYLVFLFKTIKISTRSPDIFSGLLVMGIAILIVTESFMNISSMLGIIPLSGMPLLFVSHGGTALIIALGAAGIIANVSKYQKDLVN
jgi:cell division protein FtsW